jgi:predicted AAA+ superfamily ATPase
VGKSTLLQQVETHRALPHSSQALSSRLERLRILPLSQGEIDRVHETWLEQLFDYAVALLTPQPLTTTRAEYIARMVTGGFPLALAASSPAAKYRWVGSYVSLTHSRDVKDLSEIRDGTLLPDVLQRRSPSKEN